MVGVLSPKNGLPEFSVAQMMDMYCYSFGSVIQIANRTFVAVVLAHFLRFLAPCVGVQIVAVERAHMCMVPVSLRTTALFEFLAAAAAAWLVALLSSGPHAMVEAPNIRKRRIECGKFTEEFDELRSY